VKSLLPIVGCLAACAVTEENFPVRFSEAWCAASKRCDEDAYFDRWLQGTADCTAHTTNNVADRGYGNGNDACKFNEEAAAACLERVGPASCAQIASEDWYEACASAWDCVAVFTP
jgi:hypothetical protein